tara:strand:- start:38 stop:214 length:177 start_codon:yes stop_codon:yes gene_type:complete
MAQVCLQRHFSSTGRLILKQTNEDATAVGDRFSGKKQGTGALGWTNGQQTSHGTPKRT